MQFDEHVPIRADEFVHLEQMWEERRCAAIEPAIALRPQQRLGTVCVLGVDEEVQVAELPEGHISVCQERPRRGLCRGVPQCHGSLGGAGA